jgi:hypothetical protein
VAAVPKPTTTVEAREKKGAGPLPWIIVGVGGAAAATGVVMYVVGSGAPPAGCLSGLCDNRFDDGTPNSTASGRTVSGSTESCASIPTANGCSRSAYNQKRQSDAGQLNGFKVVGIITAASGGVLAAGGLVYYLLARPKAQETAWLVPFVTERSQGLAVEGRF